MLASKGETSEKIILRSQVSHHTPRAEHRHAGKLLNSIIREAVIRVGEQKMKKKFRKMRKRRLTHTHTHSKYVKICVIFP